MWLSVKVQKNTSIILKYEKYAHYRYKKYNQGVKNVTDIKKMWQLY